MKIAVVGPSPVPFAFGGVESLLGSLRDRIASLTGHQAELIKLPSRELSFWELLESYRQFWSLDLSHFDMVISTKYPAWMVRHPHHVCYMQHRLRGLYDTYHLTGQPTEVRVDVSPVDRLLQFMERHAASSADVLQEFFHLLDNLREAQSGLPRELFKFPGPLIRLIVHFLDDHALSPRRIRRFCAISATVARRPGYFPPGAAIEVVHHPSHLSGLADTGQEYLFTTSRLDGSKRIDLVVKAMLLAKAPLPLKIAGTGPEEQALRNLARDDTRIEFLGFVPDEALVELYGSALAVLYVPYEEDYGLVTIEAMMSRKPVITCVDSGGPLEFVEDGKTGLIARPDPEDIADKIDRLAARLEGARAMGHTGYERVSEITWERTVGALLRDLTDRSRMPSSSRADATLTASRSTPERNGARPKVTVAVPFPVYPPIGGGQQRVFNLYRHVARAFDVELVTLAEADSPPFEGEIAPGLKEIRVPKSVKHQEEEDRIARRAGGVPIADIAIPLVWEHAHEYLRRLAGAMESAAIVVASHPYWLPAIRRFQDRQLLVYEAHNVEYRLKEEALSKCGSHPRELVDVVREVEAEACRRASLVLCCSSEDREELCRLYGLDPARVVMAPNGVEVEAVHFAPPARRHRLKAEVGVDGERIALFVGSWHPPNLEAAEAVFQIAGKCPEVKFLLAGSQCVPLGARPRPDNVGLMGVVDDETLAVLLSLADVGLNPMLGGSGTNLKMATYLAAGLPVITTPLGARGYDLVDGEHALICRVEEFPEKIAYVLGDTRLAGSLAHRGRRLVEQRYDWKAVASKVTLAFRSLLGLPASTDDPLDELIDRVSTAMAELGVPEDHSLVGQVASAVTEMGFSGVRTASVAERTEPSPRGDSLEQLPMGLCAPAGTRPEDPARPPTSPEERLADRLRALGLTVRDCEIDLAAYRRYVAMAEYSERHPTYYPAVRAEKSLEHYLAATLLGLNRGDVYIDIASQHSPAPEIYRRLFGVTAYRQDLSYPPGLHGDAIGGDAAALPVPDGFATKIALHCSFEHFEGDSDSGFVREAARVLRRSGAACIVPLYLSEEYTVQTDPALAEEVPFEPDAAVHYVPGWNNRHGRFYDPEHLVARVIRQAGGMDAEIYRITNATAVDPVCHVRFALVLRRRAPAEDGGTARPESR